ncbi:MAG TPA: lamin tail domain-containing protein [Chloroflexia bacterium]|nr:lamin tail domain-containing protein [Chloroflexia bacterium]
MAVVSKTRFSRPLSVVTGAMVALALVLAGSSPAGRVTGASAALPVGEWSAQSPHSTTVVISEFRTRGPAGASDEFVELFNLSASPVDISGWLIRGSNGGGAVSTRVTISSSTILQPGQHYLAVNAAYTGSVAGDPPSYSTGITDDGGIAIFNGATIIDQVGMSTGSAYLEGTVLPPFGSANTDRSYRRINECVDSDDNVTDFGNQTVSPSTPQNRASALTPCGAATATATSNITNTPALFTPTSTNTTFPASATNTTVPPTASNTSTSGPTNTPGAGGGGLIISQVYGGGGNSGAPWRNDFIEIFNRGSSTVTVNNWSVQYTSTNGNTWQQTAFSATIPPGSYYLIQEVSGGANGNPLPTPDATGTIAMSATAGKIALVNSITLLTGTCPLGANVVDFVGYGTGTNCFEGGGVAPTISNTTSDIRNGAGCVDTDNNNSDFMVTSAIVPRNSASDTNDCGDGTPSPTPSPGPSNTPGPTNTPIPQSNVLLYMLYYKTYATGQSDEAVRLINMGASPAPVGSWSIVGATGAITLPVGASIPGNSKIWVANNAVSFRILFGFSPNFEYGTDSDPGVPQASASAGFNFPDAGDALRLRNDTAGNVDTLVYKNGSTGTTGWVGTSVQPYLPTGQPSFKEDGQILYRKLDEVTGRPFLDTNTNDDWAQDNDPTGSGTPTPGGREYDDINGKKTLRPGWPITDPSLEDMFFTKTYTETNVTTKFLVAPDNTYDAVVGLIRSAQTSLTIETYEWHNAPLVTEIIDAKNRGISITIAIEGNPCCFSPPRPDDDTLWAAQQWEAAGIPVYFFSGYPGTIDDQYRYNNVHAKIMIVDNAWVLTGSENFALSGMPNDPKGNGTAGNRGSMIITNAPNVVAYTRRMVDTDFALGRYADLVRYPGLGTPPPDYTPTPFPDQTGYTVLKPTPLVVTETQRIEIVQAPDNALRDVDSLLGLVNRAGAGDEVMVEQQYERKYWQSSTLDGPNPRLEAYIRAAQRGATVRILLDAAFDDCGSTHNSATVQYLSSFGLANLQGRIGQPSNGPIHNKEVLVRIGSQGYIHSSSINGSANSSKNNREYGLQIASNAGYQYYKEVFDYDWSVGYVGTCFATPTPTVTGTTTPPTATPTIPPLPCNALANPGFETGNLSPWVTTTPGVTAAVDSSNPHSGIYSVAVTHSFTATSGGSQGIYQDIPGTVVAAQTYQVQGYVYRPDNNIQSARVRVAWYNCADFSCGQASTSDVFAGDRGVAGWQFFSGGVTPPAGAIAARYRLIFYNENATASTIRFDDVAFECFIQGTATTVPSFTPTPVVNPSMTATATVVVGGSATATVTAVVGASSTATVTATVSGSMTPTATSVVSGSATATITAIASGSMTATATVVVSGSSTATRTPTQQQATGTSTSLVVTATSTAIVLTTPTPCSLQFTDVPANNTFYTQVRCLTCRGIMSGYACGGEGEPCDEDSNPYFRPNVDITRGQIAKIVSNSAGFNEEAGEQIYEDVPPASTFYAWINRLSMRGHMGGYPCGTDPNEPCEPPNNRPYFRPNSNATRGQLSKIVSNAAGYGDTPPGQIFEDVPDTNIFYLWIQRLASRGIMGGYPCGGEGEPCVVPDNRPYFRWGARVTRGQASKIVANTFFPNCQTPSR